MPKILHGDASDYFLAAERKLDIARYHGEQLLKLLPSSGPVGPNDLPSVPVQAHFEGLLSATIAAGDKTADGLRKWLDPNATWATNPFMELEQTTPGGPMVSELGRWFSTGIIRHARYVRNQAMHSHYDKAATPSEFVVSGHGDRNEPEYEGDRELGRYSVALLEEVDRFDDLLRRVHDATAAAPQRTTEPAP